MFTRRSLLAAIVAVTLAGPTLAQSEGTEFTRINPNTASPAELQSIPGLSPVLVQAIQRQRPFASIVDFNQLVRKTLSEAKADALYERLFMPINLNTATEEEIALIPGMTRRMIGEFLEYRPYESIEVFNREIGKYVDKAEVARLRSYVTL